MKKLDRLTVVIFTLCLIFSSIAIPALFVMTQPSYYKTKLEKVGILTESGQLEDISYINGDYRQNATFTNEQSDTIITHITDFLSHKKDSFVLYMNGVEINGKITDDVSIFGQEASTHMLDVRVLCDNIKVIVISVGIVLICCVIYMVYRKKDIKSIAFKYSLCTITGLIAVILLFLFFVFIKSDFSFDYYFSTLWEYMHYIFFPFSPNAFIGSFFNDALTYILTLDFFMSIVANISAVLIFVVSAWLIIAGIIRKQKTNGHTSN